MHHKHHCQAAPTLLVQDKALLLKSKVMQPARLPTPTSRRHTKTKVNKRKYKNINKNTNIINKIQKAHNSWDLAKRDFEAVV